MNSRLKPFFYALILFQLLDGILTYIGLGKGVREGNPLVERMIIVYGIIPTLIFVKGIAILAIIMVQKLLVPRLKRQSTLVFCAVFFITALYFMTIVSWCFTIWSV